MDVNEHIDAVDAEGKQMASAVAQAAADAPVPTCPEWLLRDLVHHQGGVHRWATAYVAGAKGEASDIDFESAVGPRPGDGDLVEWFRDGHAALVSALRAASPELRCWTFLPAPSPLAMWSRRQAHETAIHRVDAELTAGLPPAPVTAAFGADGIDEMLTLFVPRRKGDPRADPARTLSVRCDDDPARWRVTIGTEGVQTEAGRGNGPADEADCVVRGSASDLYHALWNRIPTEQVSVEGQPAALDLLLNRSIVRWG
jgi:uncharacterized protein (TIGR03083 family)